MNHIVIYHNESQVHWLLKDLNRVNIFDLTKGSMKKKYQAKSIKYSLKHYYMAK